MLPWERMKLRNLAGASVVYTLSRILRQADYNFCRALQNAAYGSLPQHFYMIIWLLVKMAKDKVSMPSSMGGLVRYFDEYKSKITFSPGVVIVVSIVIIILMIFFHAYGAKILGL